MQMKISTNCSPLVILWIFFQTKQSHSAREGVGRVGELSWLGLCGFFFLNKRHYSSSSFIFCCRCYEGVLFFFFLFGGDFFPPPPSFFIKKVDLFAEALSRFIRPPETAFESVYCEIHSSNLDKILTVY